MSKTPRDSDAGCAWFVLALVFLTVTLPILALAAVRLWGCS